MAQRNVLKSIAFRLNAPLPVMVVAVVAAPGRPAGGMGGLPAAAVSGAAARTVTRATTARAPALALRTDDKRVLTRIIAVPRFVLMRSRVARLPRLAAPLAALVVGHGRCSAELL